jgi:hypothetical protein
MLNPHRSEPDRPRSRRRRLLLAAGGVAALTAFTGHIDRAAAQPAACATPPTVPAPFAPPDPNVSWSAGKSPTSTRIVRHGDGFSYLVNGVPAIIRGMGYNPPVDGLSIADRHARLTRDVRLMRTAGVNTLIGWNPAAIDGLTLDVAHQHDLGVALPFDVDFEADYRDPAVRDAFRAAVLAWVEQYRQHPAVRMWAIGNEVLQRSVPPVWCSSPPTDEAASRADAWASLLVEVADRVHAADPLHPIMTRDAEDAYVGWVGRALQAQSADRPWLIYGTNAYTPRLAEILDRWPGQGWSSPLLVSEFAPLDAPRGQRADLLRDQWSTIQAYASYVLGGAVYVWSTDGPEDVDRSFGLVDENTQPVDDALDAIAELYRADRLSRATASAR